MQTRRDQNLFSWHRRPGRHLSSGEGETGAVTFLPRLEGVNDEIRLLGGTPADPASASFVRDLLAKLERLAALSAR